MIVLAERCHYCSRWRPPSDLVAWSGGVRICLRCLEWHDRALRMLGGAPPPGCQECGRTFAELWEGPGGGDLSMYVHMKDAVYQILCKPCSDRYFPLRRDLYGETEFGHGRGLQ